MVQPPAAVVQAQPVSEVEAGDPVLVRDFFRLLSLGSEASVPRDGVVCSYMDVSALFLYYRNMSGVLVLVPHVRPMCDAPLMVQQLQKMEMRSDWEIPNLAALKDVATASDALGRMGKMMLQARRVLKTLKNYPDGEEGLEILFYNTLLGEALTRAREAIPAVITSADLLVFDNGEVRLMALSLAHQAMSTVEACLGAVHEGKGLTGREMHRLVKKVLRPLSYLRKVKVIDLPRFNPFDV
uniref:Uncharacterized protein n=1 Tax=Oryza nivara TaxID=4536 RepID=A0A0E0IRL1_ORYNI